MRHHCPACGESNITIFYSLDRVPVHSVRLLRSKEEAIQFPTGEIKLAHCSTCGFICNLSYDPNLQDYAAEYESTQAYSPTFNAFASKLAQQLVDRYDLHGKKIIEIGCGQGEFLSLLCSLGQNQGIGFDPAYDPARSALSEGENIQIVPDTYSEKYSSIDADFICCKMTLEHIRDVGDFVGMLRQVIGDRTNTTVFFQVPDVDRVLQEVAFWDVYYEHCSYFSLGSLTRLFRRQGFEVSGLWRDYGDQYLMLDARPALGPTEAVLPQEDDLEAVARGVEYYATHFPQALDRWKEIIHQATCENQKVILWGSGSKGVAFLTTLGLCEEIQYTVDINPNKDGTYMAGTGQKVVSPAFMQEFRPDLVILMNPLYQHEVQKDLAQRGLAPRIISVGT